MSVPVRATAALGSAAAGFAAVLGLHAASAKHIASRPPTTKASAPPAGQSSNAGATAGAGSTTATSAGGAPGGGGTQAAGPPANNQGAPASAVGTAEQYGYGVLSAKVTVHGHRIVDVQLANIQVAESYSQMLAQQVVPMLRQEVLQAQSAQVNAISGATYTSEAYLYSVQSALDKLHA